MTVYSRQHNDSRYLKSSESEIDKRDKLRLELILQLIDPCESILDVGCRDGFIMNLLLKNQKAKKVIGVDNSQSAIDICQKKGLNVKYIESADKEIPFSKESFDCVVAGEIIEHLYDIGTFLKELYRILKPNGQLIITTPNLASIGSRLRLFRGKSPWMIENIIDQKSAGHIRYFTFQSLEEVLQNFGFKITKERTNVIQFGIFNIQNKFLTNTFYTLGSTIVIKAIKIGGIDG